MLYEKECLYCKKPFTSKRKNSIVCSRKCSANYNRKLTTPEQRSKTAKKIWENPEHRKKMSEIIKKTWKEHPERFSSGEKLSKAVGKGTIGKFRPMKLDSLFQLSKRTISKILKRLNIGCLRCRWNESSCDLHHIRGKKILNPNHHSNLTILCPNCHRLAHTNKITPEEMMNLEQSIGDSWKEVYYG